jgi:hypothetical protein
LALTRVAVQEDGRSTDMSVSEFLGLKLDRRVKLVLQQHIQFFDEAGRPLSIADGLKQLRAIREPETVPSR